MQGDKKFASVKIDRLQGQFRADAGGVKQETMKYCALGRWAGLCVCPARRNGSGEAANVSSTNACEALGGDRYLNMQNREEAGAPIRSIASG